VEALSDAALAAAVPESSLLSVAVKRTVVLRRAAVEVTEQPSLYFLLLVS
jgi:hypothetical protein